MASTSVVLDASSDEEDTSLIYAVLPPLIKRSMPKMRSLRRTLGGYNSAALVGVGRPKSPSTDSSRAGSTTPPPPYHDPVPLLTSVLSDGDAHETFSSPRRSLALDPSIWADSERSGIRWEFASQGLSLLTLSAQGSSYPSSNPEFSRQLYIDSVSYCLRGLPLSLSEEEKLRLRAAIPNELALSESSVARIVVRGQTQENESEENPTMLHRTVAMVVLQFFLLFSFLLPYIQTFCRSAYEYEREHHISEKLLNQSWSTANAISKNSLTVAKTVCSWNNGQVGAALEDVVFWWVQGVTGGLRDGVKDGMEVFGVKAIDHRGKRPVRR